MIKNHIESIFFHSSKTKKNEFQIIIKDTNSNRHVKLLWVAEDPSGSYIIAAGVRQSTSNSNKYNGYVVKVLSLKFVVKINIFSQLNAATGQKIWSFDIMDTDRSGFESVQFTEDGGFIVGGFKNSGLIPMPTFKSGGQARIDFRMKMH